MHCVIPIILLTNLPYFNHSVSCMAHHKWMKIIMNTECLLCDKSKHNILTEMTFKFYNKSLRCMFHVTDLFSQQLLDFYYALLNEKRH